MTKKILYIDMDGVLVDLDAQMKLLLGFPQYEKYKGSPDHIPGVFRDPPPYEDSIEAVNKLYDSDKYDMFIATSSPWGNPQAAADKRYWIEKYFGRMFHKRLILTHRKDLLIGNYLIDDRPTMNGADKFKGHLLDFGWNYKKNKWNTFYKWDKVLDYLL
jgi:5'(3')-deoxyribonucleotidase